MTFFLIFIFLILLVMFVFLSGQLKASSLKGKQTKEQFIGALEKILEGNLEDIEGEEDAFRIRFAFEGQRFVYEDIEMAGFKEKSRKAYLRAEMSNKLTLNLVAIEQAGSILPSKGLMNFFQDKTGFSRRQVLNMPRQLKEFEAKTNNFVLTGKLLSDSRVVQVLAGFRNVNWMGVPFISLRMDSGTLTLEFHSTDEKKPSLDDLCRNVVSIENYLDKMLIIINKLKELTVI